MLELEKVETYYGKVQALKGVTIKVKEESIVALLGANGAGKSTTLRTISGLIPSRGGSIQFLGERIETESPERIVRKGISHVPEGRDLFYGLTVDENLAMGAYTRKDRAEIERSLSRVYAFFPRLQDRRKQYAGTLSGGEQQMLAIGRALMSNPKLILLDEPSLGLAPLMVREIFRIIQEINREGTAILLVEQNAHMALQVARFGYVLETGRIVLQNRSELLLEDQQIKEKYLGTR
ncbi:MAG: ABC transporter ATP-binding protein [Desulfomonile tiedjei]|uniref:ABC transporter ATP-binding protein n=1 Tax=Desulfomonile tiedjei TaxID=2358 RepID=A0A9D6V158_9BACT|nr:ABC transporter ATP-binding protein [Desulfomonile tiedjei]